MNENLKNTGLTEDVSKSKISGDAVTTEVEMVINESTLDLLKKELDWKFNEPNSLEKFIASLYCYEQKLFKNSWKVENLNTILLENAMRLNDKEEVYIIITDFIFDELIELGVKPSFKDRAILHAIFNANSRHNMNYYENKADYFMQQYAPEIAEFTRLTATEYEYLNMDVNFGTAFIEGRDAYCMNDPYEIPAEYEDCINSGNSLKEAWVNGYHWSELDCKLYDALSAI